MKLPVFNTFEPTFFDNALFLACWGCPFGLNTIERKLYPEVFGFVYVAFIANSRPLPESLIETELTTIFGNPFKYC